MMEASERERNAGDIHEELSCLTGVEVVLKVIRDGRKELLPYFGCQIVLKGVDRER